MRKAKPAADKNKDASAGKLPQTLEKQTIAIEHLPRGYQDRVYENEYYLRLSRILKWVKFCIVIVSVVFFLMMIAVFRKDITVENFRYLLRDLEIGSSDAPVSVDRIQYDSVSGTSYAMYRNYLVVMRSGETMLFNADGSRNLRLTNNFYNPQLLTSKKYFLLYDIGETSCTYTVCNAFSELKTVKYDNAISTAAICDAGLFAVVSKSVDYKGVVEVFDDNFESICKISKDKYIMRIALSADGNRLVLVSVYDDDGYWASEMSVVDPYGSEPLYTEVFSNTMLYGCSFTENGNLMILSDRGTVFYDTSYNVISQISFDGAIPVTYQAGEDSLVLVFNKTVLGNDKTVQIYGDTGKKVWEGSVGGQLNQIAAEKGAIYLLTEAQIARIALDTGILTEKEIDKGCQAIVPWSNESLMLCYGNYAVSVDKTLTGETHTADTSK